MASGSYPLHPNTAEGFKLVKAAELIREVRKEVLPWENDQTDNAASDGGADAELGIALELIERNIRKKS